MVIWYFHSQVTCVCRGTFLLSIFACLSLYKFWKRNFLYYYPLRVVSKFACWILFLQRTKLMIVWRRRGLVLFFFLFLLSYISSSNLLHCSKHAMDQNLNSMNKNHIVWVWLFIKGISILWLQKQFLFAWLKKEKKALLSEVSKSFQSLPKKLCGVLLHWLLCSVSYK